MQLSIVSRMRKEPPSRFSHLLGRYLNVDSIRTQNAWETALKLRRGKEVQDHLAGVLGTTSPPASPRVGGGGGGGGP